MKNKLSKYWKIAAVLVVAAAIAGTGICYLKKQEKRPEPEPVEYTEKAEASYEEWLAAAQVVAVSMRYKEFDISHIYLTSETRLSQKEKSTGVYVEFLSGGEKIRICSKPLAKEREEQGTVDLYTKDLGFATFDQVNPEEIHTEGWKEVQMKDLETLISQSMLVSIYEHE